MNDIKTISTFSKLFKILDTAKKILVIICVTFAFLKLSKLMKFKKKIPILKSL